MAETEAEKIIDDDDDLFGDAGSGADGETEPQRFLDDSELDSADDEGRNDRSTRRADEDVEMEEEGREARIQESEIGRHIVPQPIDQELHGLRIPKFISIQPMPYDASTFQIPTTDHHSSTRSANFSPSAVSASTIRYRKTKSGKLESNTVLHRWTDGSVSLQIGEQHYELQQKPLVPPKDAKTYQDVLDSHQYLATPHITSQLMQLVGHMSSHFTVRANQEIEDDALERLQLGLAAATRGGNKDSNKDGIAVIASTQDPELQKRQAELAEKERLKAQRRRETASARADAQVGRYRPNYGVGLSIDDLEGASRKAPGSARKRAAAPKKARARHDYSSEEEFGGGKRGGQDEYDLEDDFVATSDEGTPEADDDDEDEISEEERKPKAKKQKVSKPEVDSDVDADADEDAEGDIDNDVPIRSALGNDAATARARRNIIEEDDDDE